MRVVLDFTLPSVGHERPIDSVLLSDSHIRYSSFMGNVSFRSWRMRFRTTMGANSGS